MASVPSVPPPPPPTGTGGSPPAASTGSPGGTPPLNGREVGGPPPPVRSAPHPDAAASPSQGRQNDPATPAEPSPLPTAAPASLKPETRPKDAAEPPPLPPVVLDPVAGVLSYLIPGLGQVYQGRIGKGLLFFFGLYGLFFYGMWMGQWRNVWLPDVPDMPDVEILGQRLGGTAKALSYRPQFAGQFWIGVAAWPAVIQYLNFDAAQETGPVFGTFQRTPPEGGANDPPEKITLNKLQREGNKRWDLGWVYTVIAGVLNLLVIYDALAGPMFREPPPGWEKKDEDGA